MAVGNSIPAFRDVIDVAGQRVTIRPIEPADRQREADFVRQLSAESRYYRFHSSLRELTPALLQRFTECHYPDDLALVAIIDTAGEQEQIGVARYIRDPDSDRAEVAVVVADAWQGQGIATRLLLDLRDLARRGGVRQLYASVLKENGRMLDLCRRLGFILEPGSTEQHASRLGKQIDDQAGSETPPTT